MKKIKSVLYNIYSLDPYPFQLRDEYERLIDPIMEQVNILNYSCHIHLDVGQYAFSDYDTIDIVAFPIIHIVVAAPDTDRVERTVEKAIHQNSVYRYFDKFAVDENALTQPNANMLDRLGVRQDKIKLSHNGSRKVVSTTRQEAYDI